MCFRQKTINKCARYLCNCAVILFIVTVITVLVGLKSSGNQIIKFTDKHLRDTLVFEADVNIGGTNFGELDLRSILIVMIGFFGLIATLGALCACSVSFCRNKCCIGIFQCFILGPLLLFVIVGAGFSAYGSFADKYVDNLCDIAERKAWDELTFKMEKDIAETTITKIDVDASNLLNKYMCSELCPCNSLSVAKDIYDTYTPEAYEQFGRAKNQA